MRPPIDDRAVQILRENVPEFEDHLSRPVGHLRRGPDPPGGLQRARRLRDRALAARRAARTSSSAASPPSSWWPSNRAPMAPGWSPSASWTSCRHFALEEIRSYLGPVTETILELVEQDLLYEDDGETTFLLSHRLSTRLNAAAGED